jgi:hypothetical protein
VDSEVPLSSSSKETVLTWLWSNLPKAAVILATVSSVSCLAWILLGPARSPTFLQTLGDSSLQLTASLIALYATALFFDFSRAKEFWMNKEMGFYTVVAALFFAAGFHDLRLLAQKSQWDHRVTKEWIALGLLWTSQYWKSDTAKWWLSFAMGFHHFGKADASQQNAQRGITQLGLSSSSASSLDSPNR